MGDAAIDENLLWSMPLGDAGAGLLVPRPGGGCLVFSVRQLAAFDQRGQQLWATAPANHSAEAPVFGPHATVARVENNAVVVRDLHRGSVVATHDAPGAKALAVAPWGDLLFSQAIKGAGVRLTCVAPVGPVRWSLPLDNTATLFDPPVSLGQHVVLVRGGALCGIDSESVTAWSIPLAGAQLASPPLAAGSTALLLNLEDPDRRPELRLLAGAPPTLAMLAAPSPLRAPFAVVGMDAHRSTPLTIVAQGAPVSNAPNEWEYPLVAVTVGAGPLARHWEHRLPARPVRLLALPTGGVLVALNPDGRLWADYYRWYDFRPETFVRILDPSGGVQWTWHPQQPFTHIPVVDEHGTIYLGADGRLSAFALPQ